MNDLVKHLYSTGCPDCEEAAEHIENLECQIEQHRINQVLVLGTAPIDPFRLTEFLKTEGAIQK